MCLGIPGKVVAWTVQDPLFGKAMVEFAGIRRECFMACVPEAEVGSYVIVHAGIAICGINESEALRTLRDLATVPEIPQAVDLVSREALAAGECPTKTGKTPAASALAAHYCD